MKKFKLEKNPAEYYKLLTSIDPDAYGVGIETDKLGLTPEQWSERRKKAIELTDRLVPVIESIVNDKLKKLSESDYYD